MNKPGDTQIGICTDGAARQGVRWLASREVPAAVRGRQVGADQ
jgi:hypothetical protein